MSARKLLWSEVGHTQSGEGGRRVAQNEVCPWHEVSDDVVIAQFGADGEDEREEGGRERRPDLAWGREPVPQDVAEVERPGRAEEKAEDGGISRTDGGFKARRVH